MRGTPCKVVVGIVATVIATLCSMLFALSAASATTGTISVGNILGIAHPTNGSLLVDVPVTLSQPSTTPVSVDYTFPPDVDAVLGVDYSAKPGTLHFVPDPATGLTPIEKTIVLKALPILGDWPARTLAVQLSNPTGGFALGQSLAYVGLVPPWGFGNPPPGPAANIVFEKDIQQGLSGPALHVGLPVVLSEPAPATIKVHWALGISTAGLGTDFKSALSGTVTFLAGQKRKAIPLSVLPDTIVEPNKDVHFTLTSASGATLEQTVGTLTIVDGGS